MLIRYQEQKRFGGISGANIAWVGSSGVANGASGITILNSGTGQLQITLPGLVSSGYQFGNTSYTVERMDSGFRTCLIEGYHMVMPNAV